MAAPPARLELELACDGARTRPRRALAQPPLQISRARYDDPADPARLCLTLVHLGGVLAGDRYELAVELGPGARATVVAAAATQIYTMPAGEACQRTAIRCAPGAALRWLPGPQILFAGARYSQATQVTLAPGACVVLAEVLVPGRLARGERWAFARYESLLEVVDQGGALLAAERVVLEPARRSPAAAGVMGDAAVVGTLWLLGGLDAEACARLICGRGAGASAAVLPGACGVALRALGASLAATQASMRDSLAALAAAGLLPA